MNKLILRLAIPNIISNITIPLLGIVDLAIVGRLHNDLLIAAIAISTAIFNLIYWNFSFLRMSTSGFTSQALGSRNLRECSVVLYRSLSFALLFGAAIIVLQQSLFDLAASILYVDENISDWVADYFNIRIWAAPATLILYVTAGWFVGMQNSRIPMIVAIVSNIINIVLSYVLAFSFDMGIGGVAAGTLISQWLGVLLSLLFIIKFYKRIFFKVVTFTEIFDLRRLKVFFSVNTNIFIRTACLVSVFTFITMASSRMGNEVLSVNTMLLQLFTFFSYMMDGFAYAIEALSGKYFGAKNYNLLRRAIRFTFYWALSISLIFSLLYAFLGVDILRIFTDSDVILSVAKKYIHWAVMVPIVGFGAFILDGVMVAISASNIMRNVMIFATAIFFGLYFVMKSPDMNNSLWIAFLCFLLVRGLGQFVLSYRRIFVANDRL